MNYRDSAQDKKLRKRFGSDNSRETLASIRILRGSLRGLGPCELNFRYPISAICGRNGSGKSTLLALAACAFHSEGDYNPLNRSRAYYTYSDFFIQARDEVPPSGITVRFGIRHDGWRDSEPGLGHQVAQKKHGGRWSNYYARVNRAVVYFGIERVVPHFERSVSRTYKGSFRDITNRGWEGDVRQHVSRVLDIEYESYWLRGHRNYRIPMVRRGHQTVSGFNMGAGESALFAIFEAIYSAEESLLLVIDEVELGLHERAQRMLVRELKNVCEARPLQVVCTTHSAAILDELPPESRFFLERSRGKTRIIPGIASGFAAGRLGAQNSAELEVLVEDDVAVTMLGHVLDHEARLRTRIVAVGSAAATMRTLAAKFIGDRFRMNFVAVLDGDQRTREAENTSTFLQAVESSKLQEDAKTWISTRILYLPGQSWPEGWLIEKCLGPEALPELAPLLGIDEDALADALDGAQRAGKHSEFHELGVRLARNKESVRESVVSVVTRVHKDDFENVLLGVTHLLP